MSGGSPVVVAVAASVAVLHCPLRLIVPTHIHMHVHTDRVVLCR